MMSAWQEYADLSLKQRNNWDVAAVNLACAQGLPGAETIDIDGCLRTLDDWAARAGRNLDRVAEVFHQDPAASNNSWAFFRAVDLATCLKRGLGISYNLESHEQPDEVFFADARNLFVHEVIQNRKGTCSSLPVVYVAVGRRLGYPLQLVEAKRHLFARWEEPGERFNIEITSSGGMNSYPDEHYLRWPLETTLAEVGTYRFLKSLGTRDELAHFLGARAICWQANNDHRQATEVFAWVNELLPEDPGYVPAFYLSKRRWREKLDREAGAFFPPMRLIPPPRKYPALPMEIEHDLLYFEVSEQLLENSIFEERWWGPMRRNPTVLPPGFPGFITVRYPEWSGQRIEITFSPEPPPDWQPQNLRNGQGEQHV